MFETLIGALGTTLDGLSALILAVTMGFAAFPTALAHLIAIAGMLLFGQFIPLSSPTEVIVVAARLGKDRNERQSIIVYAGLLLLLLGATGTISTVVAFIGDDILSAMMAGVGIMLFYVSVNMIRTGPVPGFFSLSLALIVYLTTQNLVYTVSVSVFGTAVFHFIRNRGKDSETAPADLSTEKFLPIRLTFRPAMIQSVLALLTLELGGAISNTQISASLAGAPANTDAVIGYMGVGNILSAFFGGTTVGPIIAGTATTPMPQVSAILFMIFLGALALFRVVPRIVRHIPSQGIAGFLMVLSVFIIFPGNAASSLSADPMTAGITMLVTAAVDPFFGMCAGVAARFIFRALGL